MKKMLETGKVYRFFITVLFLLIGIQIVKPKVAMFAGKPVIIIGAIIPMVFMLAYCFSSMRGKVISILLLVLCLVAPFAIYGREVVFLVLKGFGNWFVGTGEWQEEYHNLYYVLFFMCCSFLLCFVAIWADRFVLLRILIGVGLFAFLIVSLVNGYKYSQGTVVWILFYCILCVIEWLQDIGKKKEDKNGKLSVLWLLPFLAIYLMLLLVIPAEKEPYDWQFAKNILEQMERSRILIAQKFKSRSGDDFSVRFTGFSDSARIGGNINSKDKNEILVKPNEELNTNLHLTARVFDTFQENEWLHTDTEKAPYAIDFMETLYAVNRYERKLELGIPMIDDEDGFVSLVGFFAPFSGRVDGDYVKHARIQVTYQGLNSSYLFYPLKSYKLKSTDSSKEYSWKSGEFTFGEMKGYETEYEVEFLQMNLGHPQFYKMLIEESKYKYSDLSEVTLVYHIYDFEEADHENLLEFLNQTYLPKRKTDITEEMLQAHAEEIRSVYLQDPEISEEVSAYLADITQGCQNDVEKLLAIEQELKRYVYTTKPGEIPENKEFLDYFLLETKEGYCTYYATAFVLLARAEGIPARYVQGFSVPAEMDEEGVIQVTSSMMHAWPEVYLEGVGWIPFEPTPSFGNIRYRTWKSKEETEQLRLQNSQSLYEGPDIGGGLEGYEGANQTDQNRNASDMLQNGGLIREIKKHYVVISLILALVLGITLVIVIEHFLRKHQYQKLSREQKLYKEVAINIRLFHYLGFTLKTGETLAEFAERIKASGEFSWLSFQFIHEFEKARYGEGRVEQEQLVGVREEKQKLMEALKNKNKLKYYLIRKKATV